MTVPVNSWSWAEPMPTHIESSATATAGGVGAGGAVPRNMDCCVPSVSLHWRVRLPEASDVRLIEATGFWLVATRKYSLGEPPGSKFPFGSAATILAIEVED